MRRALGKGLEALFPGASQEPPVAVPGRDLVVPLHEIVPNPEQPRRQFDEEALDGLAGSIRRHGLLQPLVVRRIAGHYELIAGERRLRAAERAGLDAVPVIVRETKAEDRLELALVENIQRENLTPLEEAEAYRNLMDTYGFTQDELATRVGKSRPAITNALRLLTLPETVKTQLDAGELSAGHARAVLAVEGAGAQVNFAREIVTRRLSKNEAEREAATRRSTPARKPPQSGDLYLRALADDLTRGLGTKVRITRRGQHGSIEIEFYSEAELNRIADELKAATVSRL